jgi:hypothetical protein
LERVPRKARIPQNKPAEASTIATIPVITDSVGPVANFFTKAYTILNGRQFTIDRTLIDAGSVVNLAPLAVLEKIGATLYPAHDITIRTATAALTVIKYYSDLVITIAGVSTKIRVHAIPCEFDPSYGLLLSRRWLKQCKARGNYENDTYMICDSQGKYHQVFRENYEVADLEVEVPKVRLRRKTALPVSLDDDSIEDLEVSALSDEMEGGEDVLRSLIRQATRLMKEQAADLEESEFESEGDEEEAGNGVDF